MKMVTESAITTSLVNVMAAEMEMDSSMKMVTESVTIVSLDTAGDIIMETRAVDSPEAGNTRLFLKKRRILCERNTGYILGLGSSSHYWYSHLCTMMTPCGAPVEAGEEIPKRDIMECITEGMSTSA